MNFVRIGIIGVGNMGSAHAECIAKGRIRGLWLTALCDCAPERPALLKEQYPDLLCCANYRELLQCGAVDAVLIATPHRLHAAIAEDALRAGLHVLVEKPADISAGRARRLNGIARQSGRVFGIMFNQRTNPLFARARQLVQGGELGELKRSVWIVTNWYRTQHYYNSGGWRATWSGEGGGVLLNQAPHNLDLWQWICGMPVSVTAFCDTAKYHRIEVEDDVTIHARYQNGATGVFITSTGEYPGTNRLEIAGDRGRLVLENGLLKWWKLARSEREVCFTSQENFAQIESEYTEFRADAPETAHAGILQNFTDAILKGTPLLAPGTDGLNELMISNAAYLSEWSGNTAVSLPFDEAEFDRQLAARAAGPSPVPGKNTEPGAADYSPRWQVRW